MSLDLIFNSLSDATRRDMLLRVSQQELSVSELAQPYQMSLAAAAKHIAILEAADLVKKRRVGKQQLVAMKPETLHIAKEHLAKYEEMWNTRFDALDELLNDTK